MEEQREKNISVEGDVHSLLNLLYEATLKGDVNSLLNLLEEDSHILDRSTSERSSPFMQTPLHISANLGHVQFTEKILHFKPSMCYARDQDGMTSVHVAAINGRTEVLKVFIRENRQAAWERTAGVETVLHLCVKSNQPEALKALDDLTAHDAALLNSQDSRGNTALHLAVATHQTQMVEFLIKRPKIAKNSVNKNGMTAMDFIMQSRPNTGDVKWIEKYLIHAKAKPAKEVLQALTDSKWLEEQRTSLMVVASFIATMAFQAALNPPGGVWSDDKFGHLAGEAVLSYDNAKYKNHYMYDIILASNTTALISSLIVALYLISGLPCNRFVLFILRVALWIAVTALAMTYFISLECLTHENSDSEHVYFEAYKSSLRTWVGVMGIIFLGHFVRFMLRMAGWQRKKKLKDFCQGVVAHILNRHRNDRNC